MNSASRSLAVGVYADELDHTTHMLVRAASMGGHHVNVFASAFDPKCDGQHDLAARRISSIANATIITPEQDRLGIPLDHLLIQIPPRRSLAYLKWISPRATRLRRIASAAANLGIIVCDVKRSPPLFFMRQLAQLVIYHRIMLRCASVGYEDCPGEHDVYALLWARRYKIGVTVHPDLYLAPHLLADAFDPTWTHRVNRPYIFNFMGNRNPPEREMILREIEVFVRECPTLSAKSGDDGDPSGNVLWIAYEDPRQLDRVPPAAYLQHLSDSDFTLCPPGYKRRTYRVIEALVRGSIPVFHEEENCVYDMNLLPYAHYIPVRHGDWIGTIRQLVAMPQDQKRRMRTEIFSLRDRYLLPEIWAKQLREKMGLGA